MRKSLVLIAVVAALTTWLWAGVHRHVATENELPCAMCTIAGQASAPPPETPSIAPALSRSLVVVEPLLSLRLDGRELYRQAPKISPPSIA